MLCIEVLDSDCNNEDGEASEAEHYADSAHSIVHTRWEMPFQLKRRPVKPSCMYFQNLQVIAASY